ncbi:hypothetical protein FOZ61_010721 [Perkinsus olseni]|uniref:RRM domain-containing protein n=1 Tax=Perkinsus olseni TaxID=32597 RepID=A0A7J6M212_PEROL|nr:hypothetical protein FOZ61_010721 [Perkinsus olseni]
MSIGPPSNRWFLPLFLGFLLVVLVGRLTLKAPWYQQSPLGSHHEEHGYGNQLADMCTAESDYKHQNNRFGVFMRNIVATDHASASDLYDGEFKFVTDGCSRDQVTTSYGFKYEPASPGSPCLWGNTPPLKLLPVAALARALGVTTIIESGRRGGASALAYHQLGFHVLSVEFEPIAEVEHALRQLAPSIELVNGDAMVEVPRILDRLSPGEAVGVVIDGPKLQPQYDLWAAIKSKVRFGALDDVNSTPGKYRRHQKNIMKTYHPYWSTSDDAYMNVQAPKDLRWADARAAGLSLLHDFAKVILGISSKDNCLRESECSTELGMAFLDTFLQFEPERRQQPGGSRDKVEKNGTMHGSSGLIRVSSEPDVHDPERKHRFADHHWITAAAGSWTEKRQAEPTQHLLSAPLDAVFDSMVPEELFEEEEPSATAFASSAMVDLARLSGDLGCGDNIVNAEIVDFPNQQYGGGPLSVHEDARQTELEEAIAVEDDEEKTTVMIRHFPRYLSQQDIIDTMLVPDGLILGQGIDFFYSPINFRTLQNAGYCFINFRSPTKARECIDRFNTPAVEWTACWARVQGAQANRNHYKNSPVVKMPEKYRPKWFDEDGKQVDFCAPEGTDDALDVTDNLIPPGPAGGSTVRECEPNVNSSPRARLGSLSAGGKQVPSHKVFVGGLDAQTRAEDLLVYFSQFGDVIDCVVKRDNITGASRGFGFCTFLSPESYAKCLMYRSWHQIRGRSVSVQPYSRRRGKRS